MYGLMKVEISIAEGSLVCMNLKSKKNITFVVFYQDRCMKPILSFCIILILFQTLIFGSLVKLEFPDMDQEQWGETIIHKQIVLDPFLVPGKDGLNQNIQYKNDWVPIHFNNIVVARSTFAFPKGSGLLTSYGTKNKYSTIPVFIMYGTLRI